MSSSGKKPPRPHAPATKVVHSGRDPACQLRLRQPADLPRLDRAFPDRREAVEARPGVHLRPLVDADGEGAGGGDRRRRGRAATALTASGYQAVSTAIFAFVKAGDHILMVDSVYQPTRKFCDHMLAKLGVETTYYDPLIGGGIADLVRPNTRLIFTESPGSQTFEVQDIPAIAARRRRAQAVAADGQHLGDAALFPAVRARRRRVDPGSDEIHRRPRRRHARAPSRRMRARPSTWRRPRSCSASAPDRRRRSSALRGLRTLRRALPSISARGWRSRAGSKARPEVARVLHPGLPSHPQHKLWKRDFLGASGLFSVVLKPVGKDAIAAMLDGLQLFGMGFSWGGYESLVIPFDPKSLSHGDQMGCRRPRAALPYRARGCRRFARRPRSRLPAPQRREVIAARRG